MKDDSSYRIALKILRWFCPQQLLEEIEGDLLQKYQRDLNPSDRLQRSDGYWRRRAKRKLLWNTIRFFRLEILLRNKARINLNGINMIGNYITTAVRVFKKQKVYSFINILGLSVGLASALLIGMYVIDELSYDKEIKDADKIFRLGVTEIFQGKDIWYVDTPAPVAETLTKEVPEVTAAVRINSTRNYIVKLSDQAFIEKRFLFADSNFFEFFGHRVVVGNGKECLKGKNKIAISESTAKRYFGYKGEGDSSPIGKQILTGAKNLACEVTAIFADMPTNTHMKADVIQSLQSLDYSSDNCWACYGMKTYFKLRDPSSLSAVQKKLDFYITQKVLPTIEKDLNVPHDQFEKSGDRVFFFVQPLKSIHLTSHHDGEFEPNGDIRYVYLFGLVACFIVLLACINFINLTTARAFGRAKEVGIRKTIGAVKGGLVQQFIMESFLYVILAACLAGILVFLSITPFNILAGRNLNLNLLLHPLAAPLIGAFMVVVALIAGSYPAFYLTRFKPVDVLRSATNRGSYRSMFRNSLVVFQFAISMGLIICTLIVSKQLHFIQNQNLGYQKENVLRIFQTRGLGNNGRAFKDELLKQAGIISASYSNGIPPNIANTFFIKPQNSDRLVSSYLVVADEDHLQTMGYKLKSGRFFSKDFPSDTSAAVINETCAKILGYDTHEGKTISSDNTNKYNVVGIVRDFNFASLREEIQPLVFFRTTQANNLALRLAPGNVQEKIAMVESNWKKYADGLPFQYAFVDEEVNDLVHSERQMGNIFMVFTGMAIFIGSLGLFGLITFTATQRKKEIGIRKVMGANVGQITYLMSSDLLRLVLISFVIAAPIASYFMNEWLQGFVYRINFDWPSVAFAGLISFLIALITVFYKSFATALINPVESLKNE
jgi:putative ABC transport system permease protein